MFIILREKKEASLLYQGRRQYTSRSCCDISQDIGMVEPKWDSILSQGCISLSRWRAAAVRIPSKDVQRLLMTVLRLRWENKHIETNSDLSKMPLREIYIHSFCSHAHTQGTTQGLAIQARRNLGWPLCASAALPTHTLPRPLALVGRMGCPEWWMSYILLSAVWEETHC